jgi:alpha-ribazole phosphatase
MEIYLVRHTTPEVASGICYGQTDLDVAASFEEESKLLHEKLKHITNPTIYSSPLQRCLKLATSSAKVLNPSEFNHSTINQDDRLKELHFGDWEMQAWNEIPQGLIEIWAEDHVMKKPPNGESFHQLFLRVKAFLEEISVGKAGSGESVILFTHAGVIRAFTGYALGLPLINAFRLHVDYASVTKIIIDEKVMRVGFVNR